MPRRHARYGLQREQKKFSWRDIRMQAATIDAMEWRLASGGPWALDATPHWAARPCGKACIINLAPRGQHG